MGPQGPPGNPGGAQDILAGDGISIAVNPGPPKIMTISSSVYSWGKNVNANGHNLTGVGYINVAGDVNITDPGGANGYTYRINGVPINTGGGSKWTSGAAGAIFYTAGNVGIKNSNPAYTLDINGSINVTGGLFIGGVLFAGTGVPLMGTMGTYGGTGASVSAEPPPEPHEGDFWLNSSIPKLFIRFGERWLGIRMG